MCRSARPGRRQPAGKSRRSLDKQAPGAFAVTYYPGEAALRDAIRNRDVYGGISFGPDGPSLLIATGGSPMVAQMLTQIGNGISQQTGVPMRTEDLAPLTADDPRGAGLAASALPITLAGLLPAVALLFVLKREVWTRFAAAVVFAGSAGVTIAALLRYVLGSVEANFWGVAGALTLGVLATGLTVLGLGSLFGRVGLALGSADGPAARQPAVGPEQRTGDAAQRLGRGRAVVAAGCRRDPASVAAFFDGAGATSAIVVLTCWALVGASLIVLPRCGNIARRALTYYSTAWDSTTVTRCACCATRSIPRSGPTT